MHRHIYRFPRTRGDRPTETDTGSYRLRVPPHARG